MKHLIPFIFFSLSPTLVSAWNFKFILIVNDHQTENRYGEALKIIVPLAQCDQIEAQPILAEMYFRAEGVKKNSEINF
jgi:hypothetical protein